MEFEARHSLGCPARTGSWRAAARWAGPREVLLLGLAATVLMIGGVSAAAQADADVGRSSPAAEVGRDEEEPVAVPEPSEKALEFYRGNNALWAVNLAWGLLLTGALVFSGASARLRTLARRLGGNGFLTIGIYVILYLAVVFAINLPLSFYQGFVRLHAYGLSNQTLGKWLHDAATRLAVSMVVGFALTWVPYGLMARSPRRWWLYTGLLSVPFLFATMLIMPVWIDPLFNKFGPMKDKALERRILDLAARAGIEGSRVFEVEKSVDTKAMNAYVTGVLGTKRIVLWDTLIAKLAPSEVLAVMGHEMGHYVLGHVVRSILLSSLVVLAGLYFVDRMGRWLIARFSIRLGFDRLSDVASVPLVLMLIEVSSLFLSPVALAYSRYQEHEADRFALYLTHANHSAAMADVKMQAENLSNPRPGLFYKIFRASHPSIGERIDFSNTYHPWRAESAPASAVPDHHAEGAAGTPGQ
jgi:Zn-dependent protease with chaperone function